MIEVGSLEASVCVIGRCNFDTGIGLLTYSFAEAFSRSFPTCILPTEPALRQDQEIILPNGRAVPIWNGNKTVASIFVDVFWNGVSDYNFTLVPQEGLRLACIVWDSDRFPEPWIRILNSRFDVAVVTSPHLTPILKRSGAEIPIVVMPPPLDLEPLLSKPYIQPRSKIRIGCVAAFHPRKGIPLLIEAFAKAFRNRPDVDLILHSNLAFSSAIQNAQKAISVLEMDNILLSTNNLSIEEKTTLVEGFDVFANVSRGEGYSIGPREALALGKVCVLADVGGHQELGGVPGVFMVEAHQRAPARFPEIDNQIFGEQRVVSIEKLIEALDRAVSYCRSGMALQTQAIRRNRAADFSFSRLSDGVASLIEPAIYQVRKSAPVTPEMLLGPEHKSTVKKRIAMAGGFKHDCKLVMPAHDGGFYSIFNAFFSHLAWSQRDSRYLGVLPDWDVERFIDRHRHQKVTSFCYGQPADGNIWTKLFEPLFGLTSEQMQDEKVLYDRAVIPEDLFNQREPLLTYIHAYKLYAQSWFPEFRKQYHRVYCDHIFLESSLFEEVRKFKDQHMRGRIMFGAHVRHPSHTVEQPNATIAHADSYIEQIKTIAYGKDLRDSQWGVFLATDQDKVVDRFRDTFGERLSFVDGVRRTTKEEDAHFETKSESDKNQDGFQLQHLVASSQMNWSINMAREVIRDAHLMASCDTLLHVVSNVSTAVSFINPQCNLIFCE